MQASGNYYSDNPFGIKTERGIKGFGSATKSFIEKKKTQPYKKSTPIVTTRQEDTEERPPTPGQHLPVKKQTAVIPAVQQSIQSKLNYECCSKLHQVKRRRDALSHFKKNRASPRRFGSLFNRVSSF